MKCLSASVLCSPTHIVHFDVGLFAVLLPFELDEGVLQRRGRHPIANHLEDSDEKKKERSEDGRIDE